MNPRTMQLALPMAGAALVISVLSMLSVRKQFSEMTDRTLKLEADNEVLHKRLQDEEKNVMGALSAQMESLRSDLGIPPSTGAGGNVDAKPYDDALISKVGKPETTGTRTLVTVPADVAKAVFEHPENLAGEVSISPVAKNKRPDGFSLFELRQGGLGTALGFEQGDVIHALNGMPFRTSDEILAAFDKAQMAPSLSFDITRKEKPLTVVVEIAK
jgi:S1-C subfamily serine protease